MGFVRVVIIGSDSPTLPVEYIEQAFDALARAPVVLGPARDGGYYLIGLATGVLPPIFSDMPWSQPTLFNATRQRLSDAEIPLSVLPEWFDVDQLADWREVAVESSVGDEKEVEPSTREFRAARDDA